MRPQTEEATKRVQDENRLDSRGDLEVIATASQSKSDTMEEKIEIKARVSNRGMYGHENFGNMNVHR